MDYILFKATILILTITAFLVITTVIKRSKSQTIRRLFIRYMIISGKYFRGNPLYGLGIIVICATVILTFTYA